MFGWAQYDLERYRQLRAECIELADTITDEFYRAVVINYLVGMCMKATDVEDARALFRHQEIRSLREDIVAKYPELVRSPGADGQSSPHFPQPASSRSCSPAAAIISTSSSLTQ
jgi:hypothetical protein